MKSSKVFFLHIPKTAGTSVREYFEWFFLSRDICAGFSELSISEMVKDEGLSRRFYSGHVSFDYLDYFFRDFDWLTFLRDPMARTVSQYANWIDASSHQERWLEGDASGPYREAIRMSIAMKGISEFVLSTNPIIRGVTFNVMTRNLVSGNMPTDDFVEDFYSEEMVDEAFRNLTQRFAFFGITERMPDSLELLGRRYAHLPRVIARKNTTESKLSTPQENQVISRMNRMDIELYRRALLVLDGRLQASSQRSASVTTLLAARRASDVGREIRADSNLVGDGWGPLESGINGLAYRWTEGSDTTPARLLVPNAGIVRRIRLVTYGFPERQYMERVGVSLGLIPLMMRSLRVGNYGCIVEFALPQGSAAGAVASDKYLSIVSPKHTLGDGTDQRSVGFAIYKVEFIMSEVAAGQNKELEDYHPDFYKTIMDLGGGSDYIRGHLPRYLHTLKHMPTREQFGKGPIRVLELGTSDIFPFILRKLLRFEEVEVSCFDAALGKSFEKDLYEPDKFGKIKGFNIDLESERIPRPDGYYDMVLCFELIEHLERDPMFMVAEINRVMKPSGILYLSTPNICSSRNVMKILEGYAPHFHMKYNKDRSLYRHNIEYAPGQVAAIMGSGGFVARKIWTADKFEPPSKKAIKLLSQAGYPTDMRGDNFFGIYEKVGGIKDRWPSDIYS